MHQRMLSLLQTNVILGHHVSVFPVFFSVYSKDDQSHPWFILIILTTSVQSSMIVVDMAKWQKKRYIYIFIWFGHGYGRNLP